MESTVNCFSEVVENRFILPAVALFFFSWRACSPCLLKRLYLVAVNRLLAKWLFNPIQAYSALTMEMQIKTKMRYQFEPIGWTKIKSWYYSGLGRVLNIRHWGGGRDG